MISLEKNIDGNQIKSPIIPDNTIYFLPPKPSEQTRKQQ